MPDRHDQLFLPRLGGKAALALFVVTLVAFVTESQLTQYVQATLHYRHPFFIFYLVHSTFSLIFPLHLLCLVRTTNHTRHAYLVGLSKAVIGRLSPNHPSPSQTLWSLNITRYLPLIFLLTVGYSLPGLLWFASVSLSPITDVTAIWNANAFFAYIFTVILLKLKWDVRRLAAVCLATAGVFVVVYGDSSSTSTDESAPEVASIPVPFKPSAPLVGDLLTLIASVGYGLYQVLYKKYIALSSSSEPTSAYIRIPTAPGPPVDESSERPATINQEDEVVYPPPFGLHANLFTSAIGLCTLCTFWIGIPILHYSGAEPFALPPDMKTVVAIAGIAISGVSFNAGFMILLGIWGPIVASVGNLLTIVLTLFSDVIFGYAAVTLWSVIGSGVIVAAFGILAYDMYWNVEAGGEEEMI